MNINLSMIKLTVFLLMSAALSVPRTAVHAEDPVMLYDFRSLDGAVVEDLSGRGHHGFIEGEPGKTKDGLRFTGGSYMVIPRAEAMEVGRGGFIIEAVVEMDPRDAWSPPGEDGHPGLLQGVYADSAGWTLYLGCIVQRADMLPGHLRFIVGDSGLLMSREPIPAGRPVHIAAARDGRGRVELYVNGEIAGSAYGGGVELSNNRHIVAGAWDIQEPPGRRHLEGIFRELRLHARPLGGDRDPVLARGREFKPEDDKPEIDEDILALGLSVNGRAIESGSQPIAFDPGRANRVSFAPCRERYGVSPLRVRVSRRLPDGSVRVESGQARPGGEQEFLLGPMAMPPVFEFEAGEVFMRGYGMDITIESAETGVEVFRGSYYQGMSPRERMLLVPGEKERTVYAASWGWQSGADFRLEEAENLQPVLELWLDSGVLSDRDDLELRYRSRTDGPVDAVLRVRRRDGDVMFEEEVTVDGEGSRRVDPSGWPEGDYEAVLYPESGGRVWEEGPGLVYRRRREDPGSVKLSEYAMWSFERDAGRDELVLDDMRAAHARYGRGDVDGDYWRFDDDGALLGLGDTSGEPVVFDFGLEGWYAVFAEPEGNAVVRTSGEDFQRVAGAGLFRETFLAAGDMTGAEFSVYPFSREGNGLRGVRFVPVSRSSAERTYSRTGSPGVSIFGTNDWGVYFSYGVRDWSAAADEHLATIIGGQAEKGIRDIGWALGRSVLAYRSGLENVTLNPRPGSQGRMLERLCPLEEVLDSAPGFGSRIWGFLAMNRHYGGEGNPLSSDFYVENTRWWQYLKSGARAGTRMSYYFPEVRRERLDILLESVELGVDGLEVCTVRQVPMMGYHPEMVGEYREKAGVDPLEIDSGDGELYLDWIRWRAGFFTEVLRDLRSELEGDDVPVAARVPSAGLFWNLAQGLDVERWMEEGLVDILLLHPLDDRHGRGSADIGPYVELGARHGVEVYGGMGATSIAWGVGSFRRGVPPGHVPVLKRALGLLEAGADGIELYEAELVAVSEPGHWLVPLLGSAELIGQLLGNSNLEACFPVTSMNACRGIDNHSFRRTGWDTAGFGSHSL